MIAQVPVRVTVAVAAIAGAALLAACGSSSPAASKPAVTVTAGPDPATNPATGTNNKATGPAACATSALSVKLGPSNGAAGSTYVPIQFTNTSSSACSLLGYPGVSFVTGQNGGQVGAAAHRDSTQPATEVDLAPGAVAHATLQIVDAENFPLASCKIASVHTLKVYPPNQTAPVFVTLPATKTCSASSVEILNIQTVARGSGVL